LQMNCFMVESAHQEIVDFKITKREHKT
jgi:hypothetical protein